MATSAVGPGFLTQTAVFTAELGASFGFAILVSVLFDLAAQLNIWRVIIAARQPGQAVANAVVPGLGTFLALLVATGGLAFNIGNVAGAGLGLNVLLGLDVRAGATLSAFLAIALFLSSEAGRAMDRFAQLMGAVMLLLAGYVAVAAHPPVGEALLRTVLPTQLDALALVTIVGGTVGGYITFAGAHRLLDAGVAGPDEVPTASQAAAVGIGVATAMRVILFLAALGVVSAGKTLAPDNPPASVFRLAAGEAGYRVFGLVMWAAAVTSVVGSAFTSVSFLRTLRPGWEARTNWLIVGFITVSTVIFLTVGRPVAILVLVGALTGLILPLGLGAMLVASRRPALLNGLQHPAWLAGAGWVVVAAMGALGAMTLVRDIPQLFR
jgi:Mn2+/Fe2+ NRAMP family transporter